MLRPGNSARNFQVFFFLKLKLTDSTFPPILSAGATIYLATKNQEITPELNQKMRQDFPDSSEHCEYIKLDVSDKKTIEDMKELIRLKENLN